MRSLRPLAAALAATALLGGATAASAAEPHQNDDTEFFTWSAAPGAVSDLFSVVYDSNTSDTFVLQSNAFTGKPLSRFGTPGISITALDALPTGRVYAAGSDGKVRVYDEQAAGSYGLIDTWTLSVPGQTRQIQPTGITLIGTSQAIVTLTVQSATPLAPPVFAGAVAVDTSTGRTLATWSVPAETLPQDVFLLPIGVTLKPDTQILVNTIPCEAGLCGGVAPDGYVYQLELDTLLGATPSLTTVARWASPSFTSIAHIGALDLAGGATDVVGVGALEASAANTRNSAPLPGGREVAATPGGDAYQFTLGANGAVTLAATIPTKLGPTQVATGANQAWVIETAPFPSEQIIVERFLYSAPSWSSQGSWAASWGPAGPFGATCGGQAATLVGTAKADVLRGTPGRDVIVAKGGADVIRGLGGDDLICAGNGQDEVVGGPGADLIRGEAGRDVLVGGPGRDRTVGGAGRDVCDAETRTACEL